MYHTIVVTCGISLLTGSKNLFSLEGERMEGLLSTSLQDQQIDQTNKEIEIFFEHAKRFIGEIEAHPHLVSAEYSMVHTLYKNKKLTDCPTIVLIVTKTIGGAVCECVLRYIFEQTMRANVKVLYTEMSVSQSKELNNQLGQFSRTLGDALSEGDPAFTCFAPIGGYKVMTSLGFIVGSFLHYPMAYLHEEHQMLVEIPPMPLDIDEDFVNRHTYLLRKFQFDFIPLEDLDYEERALIKHHNALFTIEEDLVSLSPFGQFLFERAKYVHLFHTKYLLSEQVRRFMTQNQHQSIFITQQLRELVKKLKQIEGTNDGIRHERTFNELVPQKILYHLYKGASNGQTAFRLAYQYNEVTDILYANYLWLDHNRYVREASHGIGIYKSEQDFTDMTKETLIFRR